MSTEPACYTGVSAPEPPWVPALDSSNSSWELIGGEPAAEQSADSVAKPERRFKTGEDCKAQSVVLEVQLSAAETEQLLKSTTLTQLGAFDFKPLTGLYLDPELITGLGDPTIRVNRALRAGVSADRQGCEEPFFEQVLPFTVVRLLVEPPLHIWFYHFLLQDLLYQDLPSKDYKVHPVWGASLL